MRGSEGRPTTHRDHGTAFISSGHTRLMVRGDNAINKGTRALPSHTYRMETRYGQIRV